MKHNFQSHLNVDTVQLRKFTSSKSGYSIWATGEHVLDVSINNWGPIGYASSGENPCASCFFMLDNSSWIIWKKVMLFTTHITPQTTLPPFFRTFHALLTPNIIFASIFLHMKMTYLIHTFRINVCMCSRYRGQIQMQKLKPKAMN